MVEKLKLSPLAHTWILDFDGTLVKHNGYKTGKDEWLPGALAFLRSIPLEDCIIILTAREKEAKAKTEAFLAEHKIRYNSIFFEIPMGERILMNDTKPSGLRCAYAIAPTRNGGLEDLLFEIDQNL